MESIIVIFVILVLPGLLGVLIMSFVNFNKLVEIEYTQHKQEWINDGRPMGIYWYPPEINWFFSGFAMQRVSFLWLFKTPEWVSGSAEALDSIRKMRRYVLIWNVGLVSLFAIVFLLSLVTKN